MYSLIQYPDKKTEFLAKELNSQFNHKLIAMPKSPFFNIFFLFSYIIIRTSRPKAFFFRYLNDYPSKLKTVYRLIIDRCLLLVLKVFKIKIIWICHNVDRESTIYHENISKKRRKLMIKNSDKILVTDRYLKYYAEEFLGVGTEKLDYISFGSVQNNNTNKLFCRLSENDFILLRFIYSQGSRNNTNTVLGLSLGTSNSKTQHFFQSRFLIEGTKTKDIKLIIAGPIGSYIKFHDLQTYLYLKESSDILFLDYYVTFNMDILKYYINFIWKAYSDLSVPFSVYEAVELRKPIVTLNMGFLSEMVKLYNIGHIVDNDGRNLSTVFKDLDVHHKYFERFSHLNNWSFAARKVYENIVE